MEGNQRSRGEKETPEDKRCKSEEREEHPNNNHPQHKKRGKTSKEATGERQSVKTPNTCPGPTEERPDEGSKAPGPAVKDNPPTTKKEGEPPEQKKNPHSRRAQGEGTTSHDGSPESPRQTGKERTKGQAPLNQTRGGDQDRHPRKPKEGRKNRMPGQNTPKKQSRAAGDDR